MPCFDAWDIGACGCAGFLVTCKGCGLLPMAGALIQVWTSSGGTLLGTQTADGSGRITLGAGTYFLIDTSGRLVGQSITVSGDMSTGLGAAATGYACYTPCVIPIKKTLYLTDSVFGGPVTLTYDPNGGVPSGPGWSGTLTTNMKTCCHTVLSRDFNYILNASGKVYVGVASMEQGVTPSVACPPSVSIIGTFSQAVNCSGTTPYYWWCTTSFTETITE